jgi:membrane associated rhomboid family serine protease
MLQEFTQALDVLIYSFKIHLGLLFKIIGGLWAFNVINWTVFKSRLNIFGIRPRHLFGLIGIPCAPILHGDPNHLFFNTIPLFILTGLLLAHGFHAFLWITAMITFLSGAGIWLFARNGIHIGASALVMGFWGYLIFDAYHQGTAMAIVLALICLYYFGGMLTNVFPSQEKVSWEGHLIGFLAGIGTAYFF